MKAKYDWSNVPKEVNWIATDRYAGSAFGYTSKPEICSVMEIWKERNVSDYINLGVDVFKGYWKDSLEERPSES